MKLRVASGPDSDLKFPIFWSEVYVEGSWIPVDAFVLNTIAQTPKEIEQFEPKGKAAEEKKLVMGYVVAYEAGTLQLLRFRTILILRSVCQRRNRQIREELSW